MTRVADRYYADVPHAGGLIHPNALALESINGAGTGPLAFSRTGPGNYSLTLPTGATGIIVLDISAEGSMRRLIESYQAEGAFQEQFNMAPPAPGRPPFTGVSQFATPGQAGPPKGVRVDDIFIEYTVTGASLTSITPSFNKTIYAENVAPAVTNFPVTLVTAPLTAQANPHIARWTVNSPVFTVDDFSAVTVEWTFVVAGGTATVQGAGAHCHFNYD